MNQREIRGQKIAQKNNQIKRIDESHYQVNSQSRKITHDIIGTEFGWTCSCEDYAFRKTECKHIHAVEISLSIRKEVKEQVIESKNFNVCKFCESENYIKWNIRHNKNHDIQVYKCKDCTKFFSFNLGFEGMKADPQVITSAMQLYFTGESLRNVQQFLELQGVKITHKTVWNWIKKYVSLMEKYFESITPQVSEKWRTDELYLKIKGNRKYLYANDG